MLSRFNDLIMARVFEQSMVEELAQHATVPVINGLSDLLHPVQMLADLFTIRERFAERRGVRLVYVGDGNNVCHSLLLGAARVVHPAGVAGARLRERERVHREHSDAARQICC